MTITIDGQGLTSKADVFLTPEQIERYQKYVVYSRNNIGLARGREQARPGGTHE